MQQVQTLVLGKSLLKSFLEFVHLFNSWIVVGQKLLDMIGHECTDHGYCLVNSTMIFCACFLCFSDLLYPKGSCSPHSGISYEHLILARDFVVSL